MGYILDQKLWPPDRQLELQLWYDTTNLDALRWAAVFDKVKLSNQKRTEYLWLARHIGPVFLGLGSLLALLTTQTWTVPVIAVAGVVALHSALAWHWKYSLTRRSLAVPQGMLALRATGAVMEVSRKDGPYGMLADALRRHGWGETAFRDAPSGLLAKHFVPFAALWWQAHHTDPTLKNQLPQRAKEAVTQFMHEIPAAPA